MTALDIVSLSGAFLGMAAYALMVGGRLRTDTAVYMGTNFVAAVMVGFSLIEHWNPATAILQTFYGAASLYGFIRLRRRTTSCGTEPRQPAP